MSLDELTPLGLGCAALGDIPETFASPIAFVDTAAAYGDGESERRIGLQQRLGLTDW